MKLAFDVRVVVIGVFSKASNGLSLTGRLPALYGRAELQAVRCRG